MAPTAKSPSRKPAPKQAAAQSKRSPAAKRKKAAPKATGPANAAAARPGPTRIRAKDLPSLKACPACGSEALAPTQSPRQRTVQRIVAVAALAIPTLGPNGKKCLDCGWRMD